MRPFTVSNLKKKKRFTPICKRYFEIKKKNVCLFLHEIYCIYKVNKVHIL